MNTNIEGPAFRKLEKAQSVATKGCRALREGLWNRIACLLDAFTPDECANYFRNAGYASS